MNAEPRNDPASPNSFAFYWPAGTDVARKIPLPADAGVFGITDDGTVVGGVYHDGVGEAGYTWDLAGHGTKLATPAGTATVGYAINGDWVAGGVWPISRLASPKLIGPASSPS